MRLVYLAAARRELANIQRYITQESGNRAVGLHFVSLLRAKCARLAELGGVMGTERREIGADFRSTPFRSYVIFFRYRPDTVEIVTIVHASRDVIAHFEV